MDDIDNSLVLKKQDLAGEPKRSVAEQREASPQGVSSYLELNRNVVDTNSNSLETEHFVQACGCKSWYCKECCCSLGIKIRNKLTEELKLFQALQMWTFTIDPLLFESPEIAYFYVRKKRAISELVRALKKKEYLISRRYFYILEWQKKTEMPHWHLLLETKYLPFEFACMVWNRNRPKELGIPKGDRPGFGSVLYSAPKFTNTEHAANYATKYLIKHPEHGYPHWVLEFKGNIPRYGASQGFWGNSKPKRKSSCSELDRNGLKKENTKRKKRTIRERTSSCRENCVILKKDFAVEADGRLVPFLKYIGSIPDTFENVKSKLKPDQQITGSRYLVTESEAHKLLLSSKSLRNNANWAVDRDVVNNNNIKEDVK